MMNDMIVPEEIYFMTPAMYPIPLEIYHEKSNDVSKNCCLYMKNSNIIHKPAISNDSNRQAKNIFHNVRDATAEA
jgi:hypothetical protein